MRSKSRPMTTSNPDFPFGWPRIHLDQVESTMPLLAQLARQGAPHGTVLTTDFQTAGTGRDGRVWIAPAGSSLLMSLLLRTSRPASEIAVVSLLVAGTIAGTLRDFGTESSIKWPNDVLVRGRKISGILIRSSAGADGRLALIAGMGINLRKAATDGIETATNLEQEAGCVIERQDVLDRLLARIDAMSQAFEAGSIQHLLADIEARLAFRGEPVTVDVGNVVHGGVVEGIRDDGALVLRQAVGSTLAVVSGELQRGPRPAAGVDRPAWYTSER
jgi:BirA family biotin operon repressor/biotin-[acetyl-CoA-carboxylase] ligase